MTSFYPVIGRLRQRIALRTPWCAALFAAALCLPSALSAHDAVAQTYRDLPSVPPLAENSSDHGGIATFDPSEAQRTIRYVYETIQSRYLEPVVLRDMTLEGLRGLGSIDGGIAVALNGETLVISSADRVIGTLSAPTQDSLEDWSRLAVEAIATARGQSRALAQADNEALYEAFFDSMLAHLDHFSRYAGSYEARGNRENRNGFGGVGIRYNIEYNALVIEEVLPETPADRAGLMAGDEIVSIDSVSIAAINEQSLSIRDRLRGPIGSDLTLDVRRGPNALQVNMRRGLVVPTTVSLVDISAGIARIKLSGFNQRTTSALVDAFEAAHAQSQGRLRGVILDLRGNPGGLLDQAVDVADLFMHRGRIVFTKGRHPDAAQSYSARPGDIADDLPVVVLVDGRSASAAEIVAAALQDNGRAVVVGSTSYGKGTVQTLVRLPNDGELTLTWSRFHSPSGYALHGLGVLPSICITTESEAPSEAINVSLHGLGTVGLQGGMPVPPGQGSFLAAAPTDGTVPPNAAPSLSRQPISVHMAEWRSTPLWDNKARTHLRSFCPPRSQEKWAADVGAAYELLEDPRLYHQALSLSGPQAAQR